MDLGEKNAVEAMLGLSRPGTTEPTNPLDPIAPLPNLHTLSLAPNLKSLGSMSIQGSSFDTACASSVSPSLSPVQQKRQKGYDNSPEVSRPKAMRLSQLLTDDSPPTVSSFRRKRDDIGVQQQDAELPHPLQLPVQVGTSAPVRLGMAATEPVTPPFSPPVLPSLSTVAGLALRPTGVRQNQNAIPVGCSWLPSGLGRTRNGNSVLCSRDSNLPFMENNLGVQAGRGLKGGDADGMKKIIKRPYKKYYSNPTPSSHCHVCARTSKAVKFAICARIAEGLCRKVTCYKCFAKFGWDWEEAVNSKTWLCVHCRGVCPEGRSQCYIYSRVNSKRESKRKKGKKEAGVMRAV